MKGFFWKVWNVRVFSDQHFFQSNIHCVKLISPNILVWNFCGNSHCKSPETLWKLCVSQNFHIRKSGEITLSYMVIASNFKAVKFVNWRRVLRFFLISIYTYMNKILKYWGRFLYFLISSPYRKICWPSLSNYMQWNQS